jgi:hypothetical protein
LAGNILHATLLLLLLLLLLPAATAGYVSASRHEQVSSPLEVRRSSFGTEQTAGTGQQVSLQQRSTLMLLLVPAPGGVYYHFIYVRCCIEKLLLCNFLDGKQRVFVRQAYTHTMNKPFDVFPHDTAPGQPTHDSR